MFAVGVGSTVVGIYLGFLDMLDLAWPLMIFGVLTWAIFGNIWWMFRYPASQRGE